MKTHRVRATPDQGLRKQVAASKPPIRIIVADDHPIVRAGVVTNLSRQKDMRVVAEAGDGIEALELIKKNRPDVVILDLRMPRMDGFAVALEIRALNLDSKVIFLTMFDDEEDIQRSAAAGVRAYLLKDCSRRVLLEAVRRVYLGEAYLLPQIAQKLVDRLRAPQINPRELEVLQLLAAGESNKEIGSRLWISESTVKTHVANLMMKLGVASRTNAVREAIRRGLVRVG